MNQANLMSFLNNLKLDEMNIDAKLAEQYLEKNKHEFHCLYLEANKTSAVRDSYGNVIHCADLSDSLLTEEKEQNTRPTWSVISEKLKKLAREILNNTDLFCQLEWLIRKITIEDTKKGINLIVKNLLHASTDMKAAYIQEDIIAIQDDTPILVLGFVAQILKTCPDPIVLATKETAVISHLFTELCRDVEWEVRLVIVEKIENLTKLESYHKESKMYPHLFDGLLPQITGVVTEQSDLDSAVDVFLNSGSHPIPLTRILVQESIYEEFKSIVAWKCKIYHETIEENTLQSKCSGMFKYGNKLFLFNFAGSCDEAKHDVLQIVFIEAYRTVKELLVFINKCKQLCLSVWVSGVSETNEITLNIDVPIVWVNDYCNFNGPNEISKAIFKRIDALDVIVNQSNSIEQIMKKQEEWFKKCFTDRCDIVLKVIKSIDSSLGDKTELDMFDWKINNFIAVDNKTLVLGFNVPDKIVIYHTVGTVTVPSPGFDNIVRALINGSGVIIASEPKNEEEIFINLEKEGLPVAFLGNDNDETDEKKIRVPLGDSWCFHTKVIWTNFGTVFAN